MDTKENNQQRKRRFSALEIEALVSNENNTDGDHVDNGIPATKFRGIQTISNDEEADKDNGVLREADDPNISSPNTKDCEINGKDTHDSVIKELDSSCIKRKSDNNDIEENQTSFLLECCEEILVEIFKNLSTYDRLSLMKTCTRFERIIRDKRLWSHVSLLNSGNTYDHLLDILSLCKGATKTLCLRGLDNPSCPSAISDTIIVNFTLQFQETLLACQQLTVLELYGLQFDKKSFQLRYLPPSLKCLVICGCQALTNVIRERPSWFQGMHMRFTSLEVLRIEYCTWFYSYDIMTLSKLPQLRILSLRGCVRFYDYVAYGSIATLHGFKKLESIDLRHIPIRDSDLQCFNAVTTLREVKVEAHPYPRDNPPSFREIMIEIGKNNIQMPVQCSSILPTESDQPIAARVVYVDLQNVVNRNSRRFIGNADEVPYEPIHQLQIGPAALQVLRNVHPASNLNALSDAGVCAFGSAAHIHPNRVWIGVRRRPIYTMIERYIVRNYKDVTNEFLLHLEQCTPNLIYLDVTGTSITVEDIKRFQDIKPNCTIIAEHLF